MKIIIAGDGKVGSMLTRQLSAEGYDITLIDANPKVLETTEEMYDIGKLCYNGGVGAGGCKECQTAHRGNQCG